MLLLSCSPANKIQQNSQISGQVLTRAQQGLGPSNFDLNGVLACYKSFDLSRNIDLNRPLSIVVLPNQDGSYLAILPKESCGTFTMAEFQSGSMEIRYFDNLRPVKRGIPLPTFEPSYWYTTLTNGDFNNFMLRIFAKGQVENGVFLNGRLFTKFSSLDEIFKGTSVACYKRSTVTDDVAKEGLTVYHPVKETVGGGTKVILRKFSLNVDASIKSNTKGVEEHFYLSMNDLNKGTISLKKRAAIDANFDVVGYVDSDKDQHFWKRSIRSVFNENVKNDIFLRKNKLKKLTTQNKDVSIFLSLSAQENICNMVMDLKSSDLEKKTNIPSFDLLKSLNFELHNQCAKN